MSTADLTRACVCGDVAAVRRLLQFTQGGDLEVLIGTDNNSILVCTAAGGAVDQELSEKLTNPVELMAVSPNGRCVRRTPEAACRVCVRGCVHPA